MKYMNLTPHAITLRAADGTDTLVPSDGLARVASVPGNELLISGDIPVYGAPAWGAIDGLPDMQLGVLIIVSALVAGRVQMRPDVVSPGTGPADGAIRNDAGQIVAVTRLIQSAQ